MGKGASL